MGYLSKLKISKKIILGLNNTIIYLYLERFLNILHNKWNHWSDYVFTWISPINLPQLILPLLIPPILRKTVFSSLEVWWTKKILEKWKKNYNSIHSKNGKFKSWSNRKKANQWKLFDRNLSIVFGKNLKKVK